MYEAPTFGSLFSGIGGMDLGLERAGWKCRWQVEIDQWCRKVLAKHWPDVPKFADVKEVDGDSLEEVDLICGGFPCQPVSYAGKGRAQADERWLWPEFDRIIRLLRPRYVLVENVPGLLARGMGDVLRDLATGGYDAQWDCIPAAAVGAPHLRYRVFIVANATDAHGNGREAGRLLSRRPDQEGARQPAGSSQAMAHASSSGCQPARRRERDERHADRSGEAMADTPIERVEGRGDGLSQSAGSGSGLPQQSRGSRDAVADARRPRSTLSGQGSPGEGQPGDGPGDDPAAGDRGGARLFGGRPGAIEWWAAEPDVGRVAYGVPRRVDRLRGLGNAVVPQVAELIGAAILERHYGRESE